MKRKKDTPLDVWRSLEPYSATRSSLYHRVDSDEVLLHFVDEDPDSDFFFSIVTHSHRQGELYLTLRYSPASSLHVSPTDRTVPLAELKLHFESWIGILDGFTRVRTPFDDSILDSYRQEFDLFFEVSDNDADVKSFSWEKQQKIDEVLEQYLMLAQAYHESGELDDKSLEELSKSAKNLRCEQGRLTKSGVAKRLGDLLSKSRKASVKFAIEVIRGVIVKTLSDVISGGFLNPA